MPSRFSSGKHAIAECDRCGFRYKLSELKNLVIKTKNVSIKVCQTCWEPDQPQLQLGLYPVNDPQAVREPRPDVSYYTAGPLIGGDGGSRVIQWGWNPVGNSNPLRLAGIPNDLSGSGSIGSVTVYTDFDQGLSPQGADVLYTYLYTDAYDGLQRYTQNLFWSPPVLIPYPPVVSYTVIDNYQSSSTTALTYQPVNTLSAPTATIGQPATLPQGLVRGNLYIYAVESSGYVSPPSVLPPSFTQVPNPLSGPSIPTNVYYTLGTPYPDPSGSGIVYVDATVYWSPPNYPGPGVTIGSYYFNFNYVSANTFSGVVARIPLASVYTAALTAIDSLGNVGTTYNISIAAGLQESANPISNGTIGGTTIVVGPYVSTGAFGNWSVGTYVFGAGIAHGAVVIANNTVGNTFNLTLNLPNTGAVSGAISGYRAFAPPSAPTNTYVTVGTPYVGTVAPYVGVTVVDVTFHWSTPSYIGTPTFNSYEFLAPFSGTSLSSSTASYVVTLPYAPGTVNQQFSIYANNGIFRSDAYEPGYFVIQM